MSAPSLGFVPAPESGLRLGLIPLTSVPDSRLRFHASVSAPSLGFVPVPDSGLHLGLIPLTSVPDSRLPLRLILAFIPVPLCLHPVSASFLRLTLAVVPVPSFGFVPCLNLGSLCA